MLALSKMQKQRVSDGSATDNKRVQQQQTGVEKKSVRVQWKEDMVATKIIEEYESDSEQSLDSSNLSLSSTCSNASSGGSRDTMSPSQLYSTRFAGLRRLPPSPHPYFRSEALQRQETAGQRVVATVKTEEFVDRSKKMPSATRYSTPSAVLDLAPSSGLSSTTSFVSPMTMAPSSAFRRSSSDALNDSRRSSSSSSMSLSSPPSSSSSSSIGPSLAPSRFAVSGSVAGGSKLEAGLEGICALLNKTHSCQIRALHVQTSDPMLADIVENMQKHMRTEFATFAWPRSHLTDRAQEILRRISVLTLVVEITIEYVPEKEGLFRRVTHQLKSVFSFFRRFR